MSRGAKIAAWSVAAIVAVVHLLTAGRYDFFRNELYFIICGRHPAFGYVDQPPLVPLISALTQMGGANLFLLRLPAVIAVVALVPLTVAFSQLMGSSVRGAWIAALAAATAPLIVAMSATFSTSTFEPLVFTAVAYYVARAVLRNEPRSYWWAGVIAGLGFEAKYGVLFWTIGIVVGLVLCGPRGALRSRDFWIGIAIAAVIALPNALWQLAHGLPFLELVHNDNSGNFIGTPLGFTIGQIIMLNLVFAPLWITGIVAPFVSRRVAQFRFVAVTFVVMALIVYGTHGKAYYMAGAYPAIFALGAAACTRLPRILVGIWAVLGVAEGALALPLVLPVYPPAMLKHVIDTTPPSMRMKPLERAGIGAPITQVFSDQFGWEDVARTVESVYASLPPADRSRATIYAENYGDASAINFFGVGVPTAVSANNQYYLWGPGNGDGSVVIAVNVDPARWAQLCTASSVVTYFGTSPYSMPYERHRPIVLCRGLHPPLPQLWPQLKHYGIENLGV